ncbi:MAG: hypothetical protein LBT07_01100 [Endomicrobium sp.]|jgi:lipopolysaccharide assembly outer membrane protein LptD (OstA)|nr:hypothetical protein [Endomicrobium sp.]
MFVVISFANIISGKTIVSGDIMKVRNDGGIVISKGNSKAVNNVNIITADQIVYNKKNSVLSAYGNVKMMSETPDGEFIESYGESAQYNVNDENGTFCGNIAVVKYFMKSSKSPLILNARKISVNGKQEVLSAYNCVEVITSSGTIYSDNAVFDKRTFGVTFKKDDKRPVADILYDGRKGIYEADEMIFYNSDNNKKIIMNGSVTGKIEMEDKIQ